MDLSRLKNISSPYVLILVGPPLSGKTYFVKEFISKIDNDITVISRDDILMSLSRTNNYTDAFNTVNQKEVDFLLDQQLSDANSNKKNTIVDMTHMGSKRRRTTLNYFSDDYYKVCVIFPFLTDEEYEKRNRKRVSEENKNISMSIIKNMISRYQPIQEDEGFDRVVSI